MRFELALTGALLLSPGTALAASFDCAKAATPVERMICADPKISALDDQLARLYARQKKQDKDVSGSERDWLATTRDKCATSACLSAAYAARIDALRRRAAPCPVAQESLLGSWMQAGGSGFEEVNFSIANGQHAFVSWLHHAPEVTGSWALKDCSLHIEGSGDNIEFDFSIEGFDRGRLNLKDESDQEILILRKVDSTK